MSKTFTPRKKKLHGHTLSRTMKTVRIDNKTVIEVSISLSDEEARDRFYERHTAMKRPENTAMYPIMQKECFKEIPVGSLEDISTSIIDDEMLPDLE